MNILNPNENEYIHFNSNLGSSTKPQKSLFEILDNTNSRKQRMCTKIFGPMSSTATNMMCQKRKSVG